VDSDRWMTVPTPTLRRASKSTRAGRRAPPPPARGAEERQPRQPLELESISRQWQRALDAAEQALRAADRSLPATEVQQGLYELARERQETATQLARLADVAGVRDAPWLSPAPVTNRMLGLAEAIQACVFDVEGVLTDSATLHARAWGEVFDDLLLRVAAKTGWHFIPFDRVADYRDYVEGRSRLEGVHAFLDSRGIRLPEGRADGPIDADTACGLAARKAQALARAVDRRGVAALPGARRYLEAAARAGLGRAIVSASASALTMLELAELATLIDERVDAEAMRAEGLRSRPAPDQLLVACRRLGVAPSEAVAVTHNAAGIAAAHTAGLAVVGVGPDAELLHDFGAERVVPSLAALLDARLREAGPTADH
jgi:HAD superfamily hydrolase (TIGR01509 family)